MGELSWWHWLIIVAVFVLLFGSKRLPDAARSLGRSMRIFKSEIKSMHDDEAPAASPVPPAPPAELPAATPSAPASAPSSPSAATASTPPAQTSPPTDPH